MGAGGVGGGVKTGYGPGAYLTLHKPSGDCLQRREGLESEQWSVVRKKGTEVTSEEVNE